MSVEPGNPQIFNIVNRNGSRVMSLQASNVQEALDWQNALRQHIEYLTIEECKSTVGDCYFPTPPARTATPNTANASNPPTPPTLNTEATTSDSRNTSSSMNIIASVLREEHYRFERVTSNSGRDRIKLSFVLDKGRTLSLKINDSDNVIIFLSTIYGRTSPAVRDSLSELITRANYGLRVGQFLMDFRDGEILYQSELPVLNTPIGELAHFVRPLLMANIQTHQRYLPALEAVVDEQKSAWEAIQVVEGPQSNSLR